MLDDHETTIEQETPKLTNRRLSFIASAILIGLVVVVYQHSHATPLSKGESSRAFMMQESTYEGGARGVEEEIPLDALAALEDKTSEWKEEHVQFDGEIPESERLVETPEVDGDEAKNTEPHPECPARMRIFLHKQLEDLKGNQDKTSIGRWSDALHLEQQRDAKVVLGYSDPKSGRSALHAFTVLDMKYALGSGVFDFSPYKKEFVSSDSATRAYLFPNGMVLSADMKQCRITGVFLAERDGSVNSFAQRKLIDTMSPVAGAVAVKGRSDFFKCKVRVYNRCVRSGVTCGRTGACPRGWKAMGKIVIPCLIQPKYLVNPMCVVPKTPRGTRFVGCRQDGKKRLLSAKKYKHSRMNAFICSSLCRRYKYFGLENGKECFCGNVLNRYPYSDQCKTKCPGDKSQICGGKWAAMVFERPGMPVTTYASIYGYRSKGCFKDTTSSPVLSASVAGESDTMTLRECSQYCVSYKYFGVVGSKKCYCGNSMTRRATTKCTSKCAGASYQTCGGTNAINVFEKSMSDPSLSLAKKFAPMVTFNRKTKGYPMDAQIYYEKVFVGGKRAKWKSKPWCHFTGVTEQSKFDPSKMVVYYNIGHCGELTSITYNFFYGMQWPCLEVLNCFPQGWHPGDWERTTVILTKDEKKIEKVFYEQHGGGYTRYPEGGFPVVDTYHPKVYAGYMAHGSYHRGTVPSQHGWHRCQYFGDCLEGRNPHKWKTWEGKMYNMVEKKQVWMTAEGQAKTEANKFGIFTNVYNKVAPGYNACPYSKGCKKDGCQANQCGVKEDCGACKAATAPFVCHGWGLGARDYWCCKNKCQKKKKDWAGVGYCPHECKKCPWCKKGSC